MTDHPIERWIELCRQCDGPAIAAIWNVYFPRLASLVKHRSSHAQRRVRDEEDLAAVVLEKFFEGLENGRFANIENRDELWALLVTMALRRVADLKRSASRDLTQSHPPIGDQFMHALSIAPQPANATMLREAVQQLHDDSSLEEQNVLRLRLLGHTLREISEATSTSSTHVKRVMDSIRAKARTILMA